MTNTLRSRLQAALGSTYAIGRELGGGAMSRVFAATETALGRDVVIKVLPPDCAGGETVERFRREILLAARLRHPHILPVYSAGEAAGYLYYTMPFVAGEPLRARLEREGPLPVSAATRILREMASALAFAHRNGVVHRDVKPENIFLEEEGTDRALLADFGVARLLDTQSELTLTGTAIGTPLYMSPEQVDGRQVDGRTDVYSLGLVGWEMLAGRRPWAGETLYTIIYNQKYEVLPRLSHLRADVPRRMQRAIERALAKDRDLRWPTADAFATALADAPRIPSRGRPSSDTLQTPIEAVGPRGVAMPPRRAWDWRKVALTAASIAFAVALVGAAEVIASHPGNRAGLERDTTNRSAMRPQAGETAPGVQPGGPLGASSGRSPGQSVESALRLRSESATVPGVLPGPTTARARRTAQVSRGEAPGTSGNGPLGSTDSPATTATAPGSLSAGSAPNDVDRHQWRVVNGTASAGSALLGQRPVSSPAVSSTMLTHSDSLARCSSPRLADQRTCLVALTSDDDARMTRTLGRLVVALRQRARLQDGEPDPSSVRRLQAEQTLWLAARNTQCEREPAARATPRWAPHRAWCLSEYAVRRTDSLELALRQTDVPVADSR